MLSTSSSLRRTAWSAVLAVVALSPAAFAADDLPWPQFRGPGGLGVSAEKNVPTKWSETENIRWKTPLPGPGTSSPIIAKGKIFLTCYSGYNVPRQSRGEMEDLKLHFVCLDQATGKILWTRDIAPKLPEQEKIREGHGYASSTPAADANAIYTFFGKTGVVAWDYSGKELWRADVGDRLNGWGSAASPVVSGDTVFINASVECDSLIALNKLTGKEQWRVGGIKEAWNTPTLATPAGGRAELIVPIIGKVLAFDPASGKPLWSCKTDIGWYMAPSAVTDGETVYAVGGRSGVASLAVKCGGSGDVTASHRLWTSKKGSNVASPIFHEGRMYWMNDNNGIAYCADAKTGELLYENRVERAEQVYASPVLIDGKIIYLSRNGRAFVVAAKPEYEVLAVNELDKSTMYNASPAVADGRLYIRSDLALYCIGAE